MNSTDYSKKLIEQFGKDGAIGLLNNSIDNWKIKRQHPEKHGLEICNRTITFFETCKHKIENS